MLVTSQSFNLDTIKAQSGNVTVAKSILKFGEMAFMEYLADGLGGESILRYGMQKTLSKSHTSLTCQKCQLKRNGVYSDE